MTTRLVTIGFDGTLLTLRGIFEHAGMHHVLVVEDMWLYGIVSDRDLLRAISPFIESIVETPRDVATLNKCTHQIVSRQPITISPDSDVAEAIQLLVRHSISCIPVVDVDCRPLGILGWRDILLTDSRACEMDRDCRSPM
ncbi:MAG: CBS domain-containing protein [Paraburkholderia sp.]|uniref:CBS domain-containing protein n=1 Tax=Paraburkholderia sp. TaxID=1926495 RepID=UPI003C4DEEA4